MTSFEREETAVTNGTGGTPVERFTVEPWLPWQYEWSAVTLIGFGGGILGGFTFWVTVSPFLAFDISAASLLFLNLSAYDNFADFQVQVPVTHHITLPASAAPMAYAGFELGTRPAIVQAELLLLEAGSVGLFLASSVRFWVKSLNASSMRMSKRTSTHRQPVSFLRR